jgi:hypothetical protein
MRRAAAFAGCVASLLAPGALAQESPGWDVAATVYWNSPRASEAFASGIVTADRGALHLEARASYEAVHAQSVFAGWNFAWGDTVKVEATPIAGIVGHSLRGAIVGFEAAVAVGRFDYYIEAEYVRDRSGRDASYTYAWSELAFRPVEPVRLGLVAQRTRIYGGTRDVQRGGFLQLTQGALTLGAYWFNPGSDEQVVIVSAGVAF